MLDPQAKKIALRKIPYGIYLVGVKRGDELNVFTGSFLTQCSFNPPLVAIGVARDSKSFPMIEVDQVFTINFLRKDQQALAAKFFKPPARAGNTLNGVPFTAVETGAPVFDDVPAYLECRVREIAGRDADHALVIGEVVNVVVRDPTFAPLTMADTPWHYGG